MKRILIALIILVFIWTSCGNLDKEPMNEFKKYNIGNGKIIYEWRHFFCEDSIVQILYFSRYGATEYFDWEVKIRPTQMSILKEDSVEYVIVSDSSAIRTDRTFGVIWDKCVFDNKSKLYNVDFDFQKIKDTLYMNRQCELFEFTIKRIGTKGIAITWEKIPLFIKANSRFI